jgi:DegV family protein with EDD domain
MTVYLTVDTLEYLKKGGRISGAQAVIGTLLSVKPIIKVEGGTVETVDRVRTRGKARDRMIELVTQRPIERLSVLHTMAPDVETFRADMLTRLPDLAPEAVSIELVGASVGPHLGPGCVGVVAMYRPG